MVIDNIIWVSPSGSEVQSGSSEQPFGDIAQAVSNAQPGQTVLLTDGVYHGDVTIQHSGTARSPITICARNPGAVTIEGACWYLYDSSDFIIRDIIFKGAPHGAIAVLGACKRNALLQLRFVDCGTAAAASGTVFFGGSGSSSNIVQHCFFGREVRPDEASRSSAHASVAVMISEGDADGESAPNTNLVVRRNTVSNYDCAIVAGSADVATRGAYGHLIEYNTIECCDRDAILIRCGDTTVRGNVISGVRGSAVAIMAGSADVIENNRISGCRNGISVHTQDHTIDNNCLFDIQGYGIELVVAGNDTTPPGSITMIQNNTLVAAAGSLTVSEPVVSVADGTRCVIQGNLFYGKRNPYHPDGAQNNALAGRPCESSRIATGNAAGGGATVVEGCSLIEPAFESVEQKRFVNTCGYGALGWVLNPEPFDPDTTAGGDAQPLEGPQDNEELVIPGTEDDAEPLSARSLFFGEPFVEKDADGEPVEYET